MFDRASKKLGLEQAVLGTFEKDAEDEKPSQQEMEQLLKKGAYSLFQDDNDEVTKEFCADDIESILAKRTRTRVVEGTKTASWLNKQGMVVSKSKFSSESGKTLDMDDPLFWQKVMPDFVTPSIMAKRLKDLEDEIEGKVRGPGRGRWRQKRLEEAKKMAEVEGLEKMKTGDRQDPVDVAPIENGLNKEVEDPDRKGENDDDEHDEEEDSDDDEKSSKLSRGHVRKIHKFMNELKSMMLNIFEDEDEDEDTLSPEEKTACQKMLLTISVKQSMFNEDQRNMARKFLKRVEGDRRRRCRTADQRFQPGTHEVASPVVREELMIRGKKRKKRRRRQDIADEADDVVDDNELTSKRPKRSVDGPIDDDRTESEDDWSDVGKDIYENGGKDKISRKEAVRRRAWLADEDAASAAGRAWPVFPRDMVRKVLTTVLGKVIKHDEESGGVFSVPVPKDEFPEYYEQIRKPMDYGTMKKKLENGEYRSAQSMQKDFLLIMQNCRKFNADSSDIVKEAREQHLLRPQYLKEAAAEHDLFLAEDGSVLEIVDEKKKGSSKKKKSEVDEKVSCMTQPMNHVN
jgi:Bromodomain